MQPRRGAEVGLEATCSTGVECHDRPRSHLGRTTYHRAGMPPSTAPAGLETALFVCPPDLEQAEWRDLSDMADFAKKVELHVNAIKRRI